MCTVYFPTATTAAQVGFYRNRFCCVFFCILFLFALVNGLCLSSNITNWLTKACCFLYVWMNRVPRNCGMFNQMICAKSTFSLPSSETTKYREQPIYVGHLYFRHFNLAKKRAEALSVIVGVYFGLIHSADMAKMQARKVSNHGQLNETISSICVQLRR